MQHPAPRARHTTGMFRAAVLPNVPRDNLLKLMDNASLATPLAIIVMLRVRAPAQNVVLKMKSRYYFCMAVSARLPVQVVSLERKTTKNANLVIRLAPVVLVLHLLSACHVLRGILGLEPQLAHVLQVALRVRCNLVVKTCL